MNQQRVMQYSKSFLTKKEENFSLENIRVLGEIIMYHSDLYYNKEKPIISDKEYDDLLRKLVFLEEKFGIQEKISQSIGADVYRESTFKKVEHSRPMISLDNTYNAEDLQDFDERVKKNLSSFSSENIYYTLEFKFDGLGVELIYDEGKLLQAITRGNGVEGEDITQNIFQIQNIPKTLSVQDRIEVRGEVVMPLSVFEKINAKAKKTGGKIFSNPRNAASGSVRMKDNRVTRERELKFFSYDIDGIDTDKNYFQTIKNLENLGFEISSYFERCKGIHIVIEKIENFGDVRKKIDFEIDGLVLKVNDMRLWEEIGSTAHHPRYAISYKFPAEIMTTEVLDVEHSVGRTGTITPVAFLEPINIGGVVVKRATLHNYEEVEKLGVGIGDTVFIKRAGEVIPKIISVASSAGGEKNILPPQECPSCGTSVLKDDEKVRYYCPNFSECPKQVLEKMSFAVGKQGFNIDGFGVKQVELFLKQGFIKKLGDIFRMRDFREEILALEGFQEKSVENLIAGLEKSRTQTIVSFLTALGIQGVGKKTAKNISHLFINSENLTNFAYSLEDLENIDDIGPEIAKNIFDFFTDEGNKNILKDLDDVLDIQYFEKISHISAGFFTDKKVCITGSFEKYSRDELVEILEKNGGNFVSSVSKKTDFLLAGEKAGSKLKKAEAAGVTVLGIEDFLDKI